MRWPPSPNWPLAAHSRQVLCRPHRWHVQSDGVGPTVLLIHGAGGATQSFRHLFPLLAQDYNVIAIDLPGQGFTQMGAQQRCSLDHMATDLLALCQQEEWQPDLIIGHSAGVPIGLRLWELGLSPARGIVGINAALGNFKGIAGWLFPMMAKALAVTPFSAQIFAATATRNSVRNLIKGTGSRLDDAGVDLYYQLATDQGHVDATLSMMAQWSLDGLLARMDQIKIPVHLIVGAGDTAVPPKISRDASQILPYAKLTELPQLGHLMHEEDAKMIMGLIEKSSD